MRACEPKGGRQGGTEEGGGEGSILQSRLKRSSGPFVPPPPPTELCGDDHAPVTRGRMRAQYPLPHGPPTAYRHWKFTSNKLV